MEDLQSYLNKYKIQNRNLTYVSLFNLLEFSEQIPPKMRPNNGKATVTSAVCFYSFLIIILYISNLFFQFTSIFIIVISIRNALMTRHILSTPLICSQRIIWSRLFLDICSVLQIFKYTHILKLWTEISAKFRMYNNDIHEQLRI